VITLSKVGISIRLSPRLLPGWIRAALDGLEDGTNCATGLRAIVAILIMYSIIMPVWHFIYANMASLD
jgi:hypothetical protein